MVGNKILNHDLGETRTGYEIYHQTVMCMLVGRRSKKGALIQGSYSTSEVPLAISLYKCRILVVLEVASRKRKESFRTTQGTYLKLGRNLCQTFDLHFYVHVTFETFQFFKRLMEWLHLQLLYEPCILCLHPCAWCMALKNQLLSGGGRETISNTGMKRSLRQHSLSLTLHMCIEAHSPSKQSSRTL